MRRFLGILVLLILTSCSLPFKTQTQTPNLPVEDAVATTLAGIKANTPVVVSTLVPIPTATPFDLKGLFCEYQFCIGHPVEMAFYDVSAQQNAGTPSTYSQGILAAYNANLFIQVIWQIAPGTTDPQFLLNLVMQSGVDTAVGSPEVKLVGDMNVIYTPLTTTATPVLPNGAAAAWTCGERVFAWKVYTPDQTSPAGLFDAALSRFTCNQ
jgi:hypothetical protein